MNQFAEAARAWSSAERASATEQERAAVIESRRQLDRDRIAHEDEQRRLAAEEEARAIDKLKSDLDARVRAAERKANSGHSGEPIAQKVEPWFEGPKTTKVQGILQRVECLPSGRARLHIQPAGGTPLALSIGDPKMVAILGGGETALACGPLKPPRRVTVEYIPKPPQVTLVEFHAQ